MSDALLRHRSSVLALDLDINMYMHELTYMQ
jgi:hypothetical protein